MSPPIRDGSGNSIASIRLGDGTEISEIRTGAGDVLFSPKPDSALAQYDATQLSLSDGDPVDPWPDVLGFKDLSAGGVPTFRESGLNNNPSVEFTGSESLSSSFSSSETQPNTILIVCQANAGIDHVVFASDDSKEHNVNYRNNNNGWTINAGNQTSSGNTSTTPVILTAVFDSPNSILRLDGTEIINADVGSSALDGITLGIERFGERFDGFISEVVIYNNRLSVSAINDEEQRVSSKYGIALP